MAVVVWTVAGLCAGFIPFSVILGRLARGVDIRQYGDHNPGSTNVLRAAGWRWGALALVLDFLKGAIPVGIAWFVVHLQGWQIIPVAIAPVIGHAYSPFLGWRGGKAVATTFGVWAGLTIGAGPTVLGLLLGLFFAVVSVSGWAVMLAMAAFGVFLWTNYAAPFPEWMGVWLLNFILLAWKHRHDLRQPLAIRQRLIDLVRFSKG